MQFSEYVSLGDNCETAFQLRRASGVDNSHFFDWCITSPDVAAALIEARFAGILQADALRFDRTTLLCVDRSFGHQFHHHFDMAGEPQDDFQFTAKLANERARADYLIAKFLSPTGPRCYLLRSGQRLNRMAAVRVRHALSSLHPSGDFLLVTVQAETHRRPHPWSYPNIVERFVAFTAHPSHADQGDEAGWDAIVREFPLSRRGLRRAA